MFTDSNFIEQLRHHKVVNLYKALCLITDFYLVSYTHLMLYELKIYKTVKKKKSSIIIGASFPICLQALRIYHTDIHVDNNCLKLITSTL